MTSSSLVSRRGSTAPASPIRRLMPYAVAATARGVHVHHLNIGQPDLRTSSTMREAYRSFPDEVVAYSMSQGTPSFRAALTGYYNGLGAEKGGDAIGIDDILVTVGGSEALLFAIGALCDPGDAIIVAEPYYTNYKGFAHLLSVDVVPVTTYASERFTIDPQRVEAAITDRTRALVFPNPGNPTGAVHDAAQLAELGRICVQNNLAIVSDEVYREFVYTADERPSTAPSILELPGFSEHAVVIDSVSKRYSACGARVGCIVTRNRDIYAACLRFAQARLSPPTVDQYAAEAALRTPEPEMHAAIAEYRRRRDVIVNGLNSIHGVSCPMPDGAFYLVADLPVDDAERFCIFLLSEFDLDGETVMLAPAEGFYASPGKGRNQVRVAYVLGVERLQRCLAIIAAGLQAYAERP